MTNVFLHWNAIYHRSDNAGSSLALFLELDMHKLHLHIESCRVVCTEVGRPATVRYVDDIFNHVDCAFQEYGFVAEN